ncbi:MAG: PIN domain-containing protein [Spirochaetaceae bacterium]|nr:PIN domain-containing protein [Spirochaetaceae bacterium]
MRYLLDACAILALFNGEEGSEALIDLFKKARAGDITLSMSIVQLLEVYYDRVYVVGTEEAKKRVEAILAEPVHIIETISLPVLYEAGRFKTRYSMSLADSVAAATAKILSAALVTKDSELEAAADGEFSIHWLK